MLCGDFEKTSITYDILKTLMKYDMESFIEINKEETFIPDKTLWSKIVSQSITISEDKRWINTLSDRPELVRFSKIHKQLTEHRLVRLSVTCPSFCRNLLLLVKLGACAIKDGRCTLCESDTPD